MVVTRVRAGGLVALLSVATLSGAGNETRLIDAVKGGNREAVRALLKQPAAVNVKESDGTTPLHWAVRGNDLETVQLMLRAHADVAASNRYGVTPLSLAATNGNAPIIEALLKAGADVNGASPEGETVLMTAAHTGNPEALKVLLAHGANVNAKEKWFGDTALILAAAENHAAAVKLLVGAGADANVRSSATTFPVRRLGQNVLPRGSWTPLMYAARQGAMDAALALAESGADLNLTDPDGTTALVLAIMNSHYDTAAVLINKGANPNVADSTGMAALYTAVDMHTLPWGVGRPDPKDIDKLNAADIVKQLLDHGANPNARLKAPLLQRHHTAGDASLGDGSTPFMRAAKSGDVTVMRLLLDKGADASLTQKDHSTALMLAAGKGWRAQNESGRDRGTDNDAIDAIKLCMEHGVDINAFNAVGATALHMAVARSAPIVKFLVASGASLNLKDRQGRTPLDVALAGRGGRGGPVHEVTSAVLQQLVNERTKKTTPASP